MDLDYVLDTIEELDYDEALGYCGDDEDLLEEMILCFAEETKLPELIKYYETKDWKQYEITVHAMKGTSRLIGLMQLGDLCEKLQYAAAEGDEKLILEKHGEMVEIMKQYISIILEAKERSC